MTQFTHDTFISPFTWRYGSKEMKEIFSERHKRILMRTVWIALAKAEAGCGLVTPEQIAELEAHKYDIDIERAGEIEAEIKHDVMAEIRTYAEQCPKAGAIIHLGATSMDVLDNMDAMRLKEALDIIISRSRDLLSAFTEKAEEYKGLACMAFTHLQPREALDEMARYCDIAVVKIGKDGSMLKSGDEYHYIEAWPAVPVDATGAGDTYAAGFLYGRSQNATLEQSARIGSLLAGHVIGVVGAEIPADRWEGIRADVRAILAGKSI